jgi:hypothetical protein
MLTWRWCPDCGTERPFERPGCVDGHGPDCSDRVCTECGLVVVVGLIWAPDAPPAASPARAA